MARLDARLLRSFRLGRLGAGLLLTVLALGCGSSQDTDDLEALRRDVAEIRALQEKMSQSIASLEAGLRARPAAKVAAAKTAAAAKPATDGGERARIPIQYAPRKGNKDAPVVVAEFVDFQCPFSQAAAGLPDQLVKEFPDQVQVAFKNAPLNRHRDAGNAAKAAWAAARQDKFWEMHNRIFSADVTEISIETLRDHAAAIGLDLEKFDADMNSPKAARAIAFDKMLGKSLKVAGTPSYFVNGRRAPDGSIATLRRMIREELESSPAG